MLSTDNGNSFYVVVTDRSKILMKKLQHTLLESVLKVTEANTTEKGITHNPSIRRKESVYRIIHLYNSKVVIKQNPASY